MSFMKRLVSKGGGAQSQTDSTPKQQDNALGLMHLRKLFAEFRHPSTNATQRDQEDKLYNMLPLFCKIFGNVPATSMTEKFSDILQFCSHVSKLMVTEVRRRASNQSTEQASCAIVKFLEIESTEESSAGWMLLSAINLLSMGNQALIDCMTAASLPSTLVKCLYLFFDLPELVNQDTLEQGCEFSPKERRVLLQKIFVQVLVRLCNHQSPAEELARKDDLSLLFSAITSWCPSHNSIWRKSAGEVLVTLSRHGLNPSVTKYIHDKGCVRHCVENMQRAQDLSPLDLVEMFVTVFCFLKDSSEVSHVLLDDFRSCQGYTYLSEFILRLELDTTEESIQALRNLVLLVGSLTTCGYNEMKPNTASTGSLYQIPGFALPQPAGKGVSVRNIQAFQVLQNVFLKAQSSTLCNTILDVMSSIYHQDNANYFILEPQHTLSQFAEKIHIKSTDVQEKFFELLEFIVFNLNFVPCKELISLSLLLKTQQSVQTSILCIKTLQRILQFHTVFREVYREVGMLEVLVTCLHRFAALLKDPHADGDTTRMTKEQRDLGFQVMEVLSSLLSNSNQNSSVFRECGGARCAHNMVPYLECRQYALNIVQQLVLSPGGDDDMGTLLGLMHTAEIINLELKTSILKSLLNVLRESHRTRTVFRKVGGFVYVMSVLVSMEGCLADPPKSPWDKVSRQEVLMMLKTVFSTLTVAMRYEPANAKFFATDVRYDSLTEAVRLLGCFSNDLDIAPVDDSLCLKSESYNLFEEFFQHGKEARVKESVPVLLVSACQMVRYLYDMALDTFDRPYVLSSSQKKSDSPSNKRYTMSHENSISPQSSPRPKRASTGSLSLTLTNPPEHIIHAGAVMSIFYLLPALYSDNESLTVSLQVYVADLLKALLKKEHNQQVMCDAGFPHELLSHGNIALADESTPLHPSLQYMFERLASQSLTPRDLRDFLRLGSPLNCKPADEDIEHSANLNKSWPLSRHSSVEEKRTPYEVEKKLQTTGYPVPLTRVKCLVSMTTPKDARMHGSSVTPAFVEFNMNAEGFGCLYLPSIAPQGPPTPSVVSGVVGASDPSVIGGIGTGERVFPPQSGLTFSTWFCVDKFSQMSLDPHPVRLFTIVRNLQGREENLICLSIILSAKDKALYVCTQETLMPSTAPADDVASSAKLNDNTAKFWHQDFEQEGQWHHLVLIFHRAGIMKNSSVSLFLDGDSVNTKKLHYISPNLGVGGSASPTAFTSVFAYIGTPPQLRRQSRLTWRQGPCHLMEDIISQQTIKNIYTLGPTYIGSFQAPYLEEKEMQVSFISEDKLVFGVHAHAMSQLTIAKMRKIYNKVDSKSIARQLAMSSHDNATPIRILHNSVGHLGGYARCLGAILMGYLGVRTFCPMPVAKMLQNVGGTCTLLGLIAMVTDVEGLYAAVKALVCVVKSNKQALHDLDRIRGYQILAMLYKKKQQLLNSHILHLTFSLVGTVDSGRESSIIPNKKAFEDILCDLEVWHEAPGDLQRSLYEHFYELVTDSSDQVNNLRLMREIGLSNRLLHVMRDPRLPQSTIETMASVIGLLMEGSTDQQALLKFGQFLVATIPESHVNEKTLVVENSGNYIIVETEDQGVASLHKVRLRNTLLLVVYKLVSQSPHTPGNQYSFSEEIQKVLGFDWLLMFTQCHLHPTTVIQALKIILVLFKNPQAIVKFRDGQFGGGWLKDTELILKQQMGGTMLGFNLHSGHHNEVRELNQEICHVPGFTVLQWLMPKHNNIPEVYILLMAMLLGQQVSHVPSDVQLNLDAVWTVLFGVPVSKPGPAITRDKDIQLCPDAAIILLTMIRSMLNPAPDQELDSWAQEYPVTLLQFLLFLYHNHSDFIQLSVQPDFISALAATLFPYFAPDSEECVTTPEEEFKPFPESETMVYVRSPERDKTSFLTCHPARKFVIDFLRTIVIDSLSQPVDTKSAVVIDLMLEASPDHATRAQQREYQTAMLKTLMDHLLAADVLLGDQAALPIMSGGNYSNMANSVFYLTARVVDKTWQGAFTRETKEVFEFISKLISQAKRKSSGVSLDSVYKSLNRTILFQLSRPVDSVPGQTQILDALHKLTNNRSLVFGPGNYDQEFLGCLCYCLLNLTDDTVNSATNLKEENPIQTKWHLNLETQPVRMDQCSISLGKSRAELEGLQLVSAAAKRVWEEVYLCKKPVLEEMFRTQLNNIDLSSSTNLRAPDLHSVRHLIQEQASRFWVTYAENERKGSYTSPERLPPQIKTIQMVGSRMLSFATRKAKKELPLKSSPSTTYHPHDYVMWTLGHLLLVKDLVEHQHRCFVQNQEHMERYLMEEWAQIEHELLRERGLWGPIVGSRLDKWQLDMTEGPFRMRKKMVKNDMFYVHYPYRPDMDSSPLKYKIPISYDSKEYYLQYRSQTLFGEDVLPIKHGMEELPSIDAEVEDRSPEDIMKIPKLLPKKLTKPGSEATEEDEDPESEKQDTTDSTEPSEPQSETMQDTSQRKADNQAILRMIGDGEKISHMFRCARIQGLDTAEGLLLFGREHFHVIDGFTLLATKEIKDIDTLPAELHDPIIPRSSRGHGTTKKMYSKFAYEDIREVHKRRYLLQPIALEVFSSDGRNYLLTFPRKVRNKVYQKYMSVATSITDNAQQSVSGQRQNARIEAGSGLISSLMGEKSVTQRWERGEINNFQYLMHLNTLAGRSYNDLMQYPVFPWILADYDSEDIDLQNPETFRDLAKPMGAQTPDRLKHFMKRFQDWDDPQGETPPYHYGTHYSSAMIVASYLVRMEPFTQTFLNLQGGHFDLADRMFHSVKENWLSASKNNMADVKELIPEFFYLPEFLVNSNNFDLGCKQSGVQLHDVVLPPWARGDPREFIRGHREALECDYVSAHLHEWIDLIFGCKQQGQPAVDSINVFHHLFYEGNVDIYSIDDPLKKNATIGFINNFGQIPKQIFKKAHPQKKLNIRTGMELPMMSGDRLFFHNVDNLKPCMQPVKELKGAVGQIMHNERYVQAVEQNKVLIPTNYNKYLAWGFSDLSVRIGNYESEKATAVFEGLDNGEILCAACPNAKVFITGGTSCVVNVWEQSAKDKRVVLKQPLYGHIEPVTCVAVSPAYNIIVSGSRDRSCIIWDLSRLVFVRQLRGHTAPVAAVCINELTGDIASCAGTYLHLWSINGDEIACVNTASVRNHQILCVAMSQMMEWDNRNVVMTGSSDGVVRMWSVEYVQVPDEMKLVVPSKTTKKTGDSTDATDSAGEKPEDSSQPGKQSHSRPLSSGSFNEEVQSAVDRLKDFKDPDNIASKLVELGSSVDSNSHFMTKVREKLEGVSKAGLDSESAIDHGVHTGNISTTSSMSDLCNAEDVGNNDVELSKDGDGQSIQSAGTMSVDMAVDALEHDMEIGSSSLPIQADTPKGQNSEIGRSASQPEMKSELDKDATRSLSSEFEVITETEVKKATTAEDIVRKYRKRTKNTLREGFRWQRQLVFRSKLTMHTAFERKDNKDPAAVTAVAISRDHKTVYVGDAKGRIFSWTVTDQPGRVVADHWMKDDGAETCLQCGIRFSFSERRHHCRNCGQVFCSRCSRYETEIRRLRIIKPVRVCQACYNILKASHASDAIKK